jgi:hypothetical protein
MNLSVPRMTATSPLILARQHLADARPHDALSALAGCEAPETYWLRAIACAESGAPLQAAVALQAAQRGGTLPEAALLDIARPFALALLDDTPAARPLAPLAVAVHNERGTNPPTTSLHLAWELCVLAAEVLDEDNELLTARLGLVLTLGALKWRMGRTEEATALLRGAQDGAVIQRDTDVLHGAVLLLADIAWHDDDPELTEQVIEHGGRQLERIGGDAEALRAAWSATVAQHTNGGLPS